MVWRVGKPQSGQWQGRKFCCQAGFEFFDHTVFFLFAGMLTYHMVTTTAWSRLPGW
jgi:hypothetical protein